jgi:hypothetical protein
MALRLCLSSDFAEFFSCAHWELDGIERALIKMVLKVSVCLLSETIRLSRIA